LQGFELEWIEVYGSLTYSVQELELEWIG